MGRRRNVSSIIAYSNIMRVQERERQTAVLRFTAVQIVRPIFNFRFSKWLEYSATHDKQSCRHHTAVHYCRKALDEMISNAPLSGTGTLPAGNKYSVEP